MESVFSSKTLVSTYKCTWLYYPYDRHQWLHQCLSEKRVYTAFWKNICGHMNTRSSPVALSQEINTILMNNSGSWFMIFWSLFSLYRFSCKLHICSLTTTDIIFMNLAGSMRNCHEIATSNVFSTKNNVNLAGTWGKLNTAHLVVYQNATVTSWLLAGTARHLQAVVLMV
jgi:hypothetical protein